MTSIDSLKIFEILLQILSKICNRFSIKFLTLLPKRSSFHTTKVSPSRRCSTAWSRPGLIAYEVCNNLKPTFLNATSARSKLGIKLDRKSDIPTKQQIFEFVKPQVVIDWPMTKTGNINTACYDMADAYVLARAGWLNKS